MRLQTFTYSVLLDPDVDATKSTEDQTESCCEMGTRTQTDYKDMR